MNRRIVLGLIIVALVPSFVVTQLLVNRYRDERRALATEWGERGQQDVSTRPAAAVTDFQTALSYEPSRTDVRFRLAEALTASNRLSEASAQLLTLLYDEPSRGDVNLALARLAAKRDDLDDAVRYYHAAIDGIWTTPAVDARRDARIELARLLMTRGQPVRAQAELISLIDDLPPNAMLITDVAALLAEAGAQSRALTLLRRALELDPQDVRAAQLAAALEYHNGDLAAARRDLLAASKVAPLPNDSRDILEVVDRTLALDPYADHLSIRTRADRAMRLLAVAKARLEQCNNEPPDLAERVDREMKRQPIELERDADLIDEVTSVAFEVERLPQGSCGAESIDDRALALIASRHTTQSQ